MTACGGAPKAQTAGGRPSLPLRPPKTVEARRLPHSVAGHLLPGSPVGPNFSGGTRTFANTRDGFAIGSLPGRFGDTYPLATVNGGNTWRIAGPVLYIPGSGGAIEVDQAGMISPRLWYACCGLNTVVDVTPDAGKHWWQAFLPGEVLTVYAGPTMCGRLIAVVQPFTHNKQVPLWTYASSQGRRWFYDPPQYAKLRC